MVFDWNDYQQQLMLKIGEMATLSPDTVRGYRQLSAAGAKTGKLDAKTLEEFNAMPMLNVIAFPLTHCAGWRALPGRLKELQ